jgi:Ni,Fe-hydrogenase III small subunit
MTESEPERKIWTLLYGPCFCHTHPASGESFDFLRLRTSKLEGDLFIPNILVVSDRVIDGAMPTYHKLLDQVPTPRLIFGASACPMAERFWDALPVGWTQASELMQLDAHISECIRGYPEILMTRVLAELSGVSRESETV